MTNLHIWFGLVAYVLLIGWIAWSSIPDMLPTMAITGCSFVTLISSMLAPTQQVDNISTPKHIGFNLPHASARQRRSLEHQQAAAGDQKEVQAELQQSEYFDDLAVLYLSSQSTDKFLNLTTSDAFVGVDGYFYRNWSINGVALLTCLTKGRSGKKVIDFSRCLPANNAMVNNGTVDAGFLQPTREDESYLVYEFIYVGFQVGRAVFFNWAQHALSTGTLELEDSELKAVMIHKRVVGFVNFVSIYLICCWAQESFRIGLFLDGGLTWVVNCALLILVALFLLNAVSVLGIKCARRWGFTASTWDQPARKGRLLVLLCFVVVCTCIIWGDALVNLVFVDIVGKQNKLYDLLYSMKSSRALSTSGLNVFRRSGHKRGLTVLVWLTTLSSMASMLLSSIGLQYGMVSFVAQSFGPSLRLAQLEVIRSSTSSGYEMINANKGLLPLLSVLLILSGTFFYPLLTKSEEDLRRIDRVADTQLDTNLLFAGLLRNHV